MRCLSLMTRKLFWNYRIMSRRMWRRTRILFSNGWGSGGRTRLKTNDCPLWFICNRFMKELTCPPLQLIINMSLHQSSFSQPKQQTLETSAQNSFVRKIYSLLMIQIAFTTICVFLSVQYFPGFREFQKNHIWLVVVVIIATVFSGASLSSGAYSKQIPHNYVLLGLFTMGQTYIIVFLCSLFSTKSVFFSAFLTLVMLGALTLMAMFSEKNFSPVASFIVASSGLIVGLLMISLFFKTSLAYNIFAGSFTLLLGCYLIVDTQLILGGKHPHLSWDDSITGAMILYSDLANMFMYTLVRIGEEIKDV